MKNKPCSVEHAGREVLEKQLLVSLSDKSKVAMVLDEKDLDLLIAALRAVTLPGGGKSTACQMLRDLQQLKKAAFGRE